MSIAWVGLAITAWTVAPLAVGAQATPYVPNLDPAYVDLDVLLARGLVREALAGQRPYSRAAFARFVAEANGRAAGSTRGLDARTEEALERLNRRFTEPADGAARTARLRPRGAFTEGSVAASPFRALRSGADGSIDGTVDPLLQGNQGRELADGITWAVEAALDLNLGFFAGALQPRAWLDSPYGPTGPGADVTLLEAYARAVLGPLGLDLGRNHSVVGHGLAGGPLLSHNPRGLDMVRLVTDRPLRLPGPFRVLGLWELSALAADMGNDRDVPGSVLVVMRLGSRPSRYVELGLNYLNLQGGEGSPSAPLRERLWDVFFFWKDGGSYYISDKVAGADLAITLPPLRTQLYVNVLTTDDRGKFSQPAGGLWEDAIWLAGGRATGLGPDGRYDMRVEWRHAGARAHTHHQFTSGLTLDGRVLGDVLGPNATGVQLSVDRSGPGSVVSLTAAWERYSGDDFAWDLIPGGDPWDFDWYLVADNPDEIRRRLTVDWRRQVQPGRLETAIRLGYEHVTRYAYGPGNRNNFLAQARIGYRW